MSWSKRLLAGAVLLAIIVVLAPATTALAPPKSPEEGLGPLVSPVPALPEAVRPGSPWSLAAYKPVSKVMLVRVYYEPGKGIEVARINITPTLELHSGNLYAYLIKESPKEPGVYDVYVVYSDGSSSYAPRALWVVPPKPLDHIVVAHLSDLHFGTGDANYKLTSYLLAQLLGAQLIINTGDEADTADVGQYLQSLAYRYEFAYPLPEILVPGNHDYPPKNFYRFYGNTTIVCWRPLPWLLITGGYTWEIGHFNEAQLAAVAKCLEDNKDASVKIMLMHHPVFYWQGHVKLPPNYPFKDPHKDRHSPLSYYWGSPDSLQKGLVRELLTLVVKYNVTIVMAGHIHRDQYVLYTPPHGGIHFFITTTSSGHSLARPNYNGIQIIEIYRNGTLGFPYAPKSFIGFENASRATVYNSIPVDPHPARAPSDYGYIYARLDVGPGAYVLELTNKYYVDINRVALIALPALHIEGFYEKGSGGAHVALLAARNVTLPNGVKYTFLALNITLPSNSSDVVALEAVKDVEAPTASLEYTIPSKPRAGQPLRVFIRISDDSTGLKGQPLVEVVDDKGRSVQAQVLAYPDKIPGDLFLYIPKTPSDSSYLIVRLSMSDPLGHKAVREVKISLAPPQTATQTTSATTGHTTTTTTATHTTKHTTPTQTTPTTTGTATKRGRSSAKLAAAAAVVIVIVVAAAAAALARRR